MSRDIRICFIGDSFVNGTGDPHMLGWSGRLCAMSACDDVELTYYNLGVRRETSADIRDRWMSECQARLPAASEKLLIFSFGVNDTVIEGGQVRVSRENSIENARQILQAAADFADVLMVGPPPIADIEQNTRIQTLDKHLQSLCLDLGVPFLSVFGKLSVNSVWMNELRGNDGAHPRADGYAVLAGLVKVWGPWPIP